MDRPTPFVAVSRAVAELIGADAADRARRRLDGRGEVVAASAGSARVEAARELAERLRGRGPWASAASVDAGGRVSVLSLGPTGRTPPHRSAGYLAVGVDAEQEGDHQLIAFAAALLDRLDDERTVLIWQVEDHTLLVVAAGDLDDVLGVVDLARRAPSGVLRAEDAPPTLAGLLGEPAAGAFARAVLAPLDALDPADRATVEATLTAWLAANGETGTAAGVLGVHRHTLRERLRRSAQLLDRDLDDPQTRVDLRVALGARPGI